MPLPKSLTQPLRQGQLTVGSGWRAYFATFNQQLAVANSSTAIGPSIYDLQVFKNLVDGALPVGFYDLGYIDNVKFTSGSKVGNVVTGYRGAIRAKYRAEVGEKLAFDFQEVSRMSMSLSSGMQIFNFLKTTATSAAGGPLSATGTPAFAMGASGYSATGFAGATAGLATLCVPAGSGTLFTVGSMLVCDQDYVPGNFGFTGDSGANVFPGAVTSVDFIRMTSDYVAGVAAVLPGAVGAQDAIILSGPFVGGGNSAVGAPNIGPTAGAKIQQITGYGPREGGTYLKEWSAVFVMATVDGSQILKYYPRVAPDTNAGMTGKNLTGATSLQMYGASATFDAMAYDDPLDGETVVSYMGYFPHPGTSPGI
jgi:hypothetical protein